MLNDAIPLDYFKHHLANKLETGGRLGVGLPYRRPHMLIDLASTHGHSEKPYGSIFDGDRFLLNTAAEPRQTTEPGRAWRGNEQRARGQKARSRPPGQVGRK
jgi:hypothetical protein